MAVLPIVQHPDPRLRVVCDPVEQFDDSLQALIRDMFETMYDAYGRGLAAPQIGDTRRVFVMDATWKDGPKTPRVFVNPEITVATRDLRMNEEACLSITGITCQVGRPSMVELRWQDAKGFAQEDRFQGARAVIVQHERDHLDGVLCIDYAQI